MDALDTQDLNLYLVAVEARVKVQICVRHAPASEPLYAGRLNEWLSANQEALARGAAEAERKGFNKPPASVERLASSSAQLLENLPADDRDRRCKELLVSLASQPRK